MDSFREARRGCVRLVPLWVSPPAPRLEPDFDLIAPLYLGDGRTLQQWRRQVLAPGAAVNISNRRDLFNPHQRAPSHQKISPDRLKKSADEKKGPRDN